MFLHKRFQNITNSQDKNHFTIQINMLFLKYMNYNYSIIQTCCFGNKTKSNNYFPFHGIKGYKQ
ncbi:MAG: hypothetical protein DRP35_03785 [Candidatus Zixiibacteriota bacterium]|nr:MAG: hypothetical protein DRP35_03785 [candidate division Zixibacteria bacterium]